MNVVMESLSEEGQKNVKSATLRTEPRAIQLHLYQYSSYLCTNALMLYSNYRSRLQNKPIIALVHQL